MPLAFVSYSHQDREIAVKLVERLRKAAPEIGIVLDDAIDAETTAIPSGAYSLPFVGKRLRNANAVISVLTRSYAESDPCWLEMSAALMMEKVIPINLDPGLSPAGLESMVGGRNIVAIAPGWFNKEPGEVEAAETAKFDSFVRVLKTETGTTSPFAAWQPAEPKDARPMAAAVVAALRPRAFRRTDLIWSPGSLADVQKRRFFAAIDSMSIATGEGGWDVARRKVLKAMSAEPMQRRVRAEALMGLIGELTAPSDGSPPVTAHDPWEFVGDFALPIDRDISRYAYTRAGKIPNELRKMFQVLRPGRSKRRRLFAAGAVLGGIVGVVLTYGGQMLFGQPGPRLASDPRQPDTPPTRPADDTPAAPQTAQVTPQAAPAPSLTPPVIAPPVTAPPVTAPPSAAPATPPSRPAPSPPPQVAIAPTAPPPPVVSAPPTSETQFAVSARGLEASVKAEIARRNLDESAWKEVYGQVISLNINTLCSPEKWKAAEESGRKPLDIIAADTQLTWPTQTDFARPARYQECPVYRIPT